MAPTLQPQTATTPSKRTLPPSTIDRYFSLHYGRSYARQLHLPNNDPSYSNHTGEDTCVARHHNGICVICISPRHPIVEQRKKVCKVQYRVEMREVKGKRKKGGIPVEERTKLCILMCEGGESYNVLCSVKGTIAEYNVALQNEPGLVGSKPLTNGYLAVVLPWPSQIKTAVDRLLTAEDYDKSWDERGIS